MTRPDIEGALARANKATPAPWEDQTDTHAPSNGKLVAWVVTLDDVDGDVSESRVADMQQNPYLARRDAAFIAAARTDVPDLCRYALDLERDEHAAVAELNAVRAKLGNAEADLKELGDTRKATVDGLRDLQRHLAESTAAEVRTAARAVEMGKEIATLKAENAALKGAAEALLVATERSMNRCTWKEEPAAVEMVNAGNALAEFAKTAPGRLPQRIQDAITFFFEIGK